MHTPAWLHQRLNLFTVFLILIGTTAFVSLARESAFAASLQQSQRSGATLKASFQYLLSNFTGPVPSQWARLDFDPLHQELYVLDQYTNEIRIFNRHGMEIFTFGGDGDTLPAVDIAAGENGTMYLLSRNFPRSAIQQLNFRGELERVVRLNDLPSQLQGFTPDRLEYRGGLFYLLDTRTLRLVVAQADGHFLRDYDFTPGLGKIAEEQDPDKKKSQVFEISGFSVSPDGTIYVTVPALFTAFRLNPDNTLDMFGTSGSGPGKFGVVSGIAADIRGNIFVADRLRSVVMIFNSDFEFQGEFGYRGNLPQDMIVPDDLAIDPDGRRVFVSQAANKGVGAYLVTVAP